MCEVKNSFSPLKGGHRITLLLMARHPRLLSPEVATLGIKCVIEVAIYCKAASQGMQLTLHATRRTLTSRFASRSVQAMSFLVGENPTCSVPALYGSEGLWLYDYGHA